MKEGLGKALCCVTLYAQLIVLVPMSILLYICSERTGLVQCQAWTLVSIHGLDCVLNFGLDFGTTHL